MPHFLFLYLICIRLDRKDIDGLEYRLYEEFHRLNRERFDGIILPHRLRFSCCSVRTHGRIELHKRKIMVSLLLYEQYGWNAVVQTLLHEMTHALIHQQGGQARHTKKFWLEFEKRGGIMERYDVKPKSTYVYACPSCEKEYERIKKLVKTHSCSRCDKKYNPAYRLYLKRDKYP